MKIFKILLLTVFMAFTFSSCLDEIVDKVCDITIKQIKDEISEEIKLIENDPNLTQEEKDTAIELLEDELDLEIADIKENCAL